MVVAPRKAVRIPHLGQRVEGVAADTWKREDGGRAIRCRARLPGLSGWSEGKGPEPGLGLHPVQWKR